MKTGKCIFKIDKKNPKPQPAPCFTGVIGALAARREGAAGRRQAGALDFVRIQPLDLSFLSDG